MPRTRTRLRNRKPKAAATASDRLIDYIEDFARKTLNA
jgi:hypothetical protein